MTDDEVSFGQRVQEASIAAKPRPKLRVQAAATTKQAPTPTIPSATPTFMADQSDSDEEMRDDDGEYTEEHQLTRIRRGRQVDTPLLIAEAFSDRIYLEPSG